MSFILRKSSGKLTWREQADVNFFDTKEILEQMVALLGLENAQEETLWENCREASYNLWQPGYSARWGNLLKDSVEMTCGAVNVEALEEWDIPGIVFAGEVFVLPKVFEKEGETRKHYQPLSAFPPVSKDIALVVENAVSAQSVLRVVSEAAKKAVEGKFEISAITIFDVYHEVEPGKKNLAFSLTFRSHERTLKDDEVNAAFVAIQETIKKHYTIRS
jgi:phenylalanyl-tRNA synthetase beta chain